MSIVIDTTPKPDIVDMASWDNPETPTNLLEQQRDILTSRYNSLLVIRAYQPALLEHISESIDRLNSILSKRYDI
jgi:hypothetical protein